jgi:hypothetical protein
LIEEFPAQTPVGKLTNDFYGDSGIDETSEYLLKLVK